MSAIFAPLMRIPYENQYQFEDVLPNGSLANLQGSAIRKERKKIYSVRGVIIMHRLTRRVVQVERHCGNLACKLLGAEKVEGRPFREK